MLQKLCTCGKIAIPLFVDVMHQITTCVAIDAFVVQLIVLGLMCLVLYFPMITFLLPYPYRYIA
jgi:hypothetical protein